MDEDVSIMSLTYPDGVYGDIDLWFQEYYETGDALRDWDELTMHAMNALIEFNGGAQEVPNRNFRRQFMRFLRR